MLWTWLLTSVAHSGTPTLIPPLETGVAPNAAVVLRADEAPRVKVKVDGKTAPVEISEWPDGHWLVRPAEGDWAVGSTLDIKSGKLKESLLVGEAPDEKSPDLLSCQAPAGTAVQCGTSFDMADVVGRLQFTLASGATTDHVIVYGKSLELTLPEENACATAGTLTDTAGNQRDLKPAALPCERPDAPKLTFQDVPDPFDPMGVAGEATPLMLEVELPPGGTVVVVSLGLDQGLASCTECEESCREPAGRRAEFRQIRLQPDPAKATTWDVDVGAQLPDWRLVDLGVRAFAGDVSASTEVEGWPWCEP